MINLDVMWFIRTGFLLGTLVFSNLIVEYKYKGQKFSQFTNWVIYILCIIGSVYLSIKLSSLYSFTSILLISIIIQTILVIINTAVTKKIAFYLYIINIVLIIINIII